MEREIYMQYALDLAQRAEKTGDVPVGCVIVHRGVVIGEGWNRREKDKNALAHAECLAIQEACVQLGGWNLHECSLYVTLEPCPMCAGAIIQARIREVFYGVKDKKGGACGSVINIFMEDFNHRPRIYGGILEEKCRIQLQHFFRKLRQES